MRVTSRTFYKDYAQTVENLHSELNKSIQQVSSERKYNSAEENPLAYYESKRIDNQYTDADTKYTVISDVKNRLYQQEQGALSIQTSMRSINKDLLQLNNDSSNQALTTVQTLQSDISEHLDTIADTLNSTYENFYVYGGNDMSTTPFTLDKDLNSDTPSITLNFSHKFPGDTDTTTTMSIKYTLKDNGDLQVDYSGKTTDADGNTTDLGSDETLARIKSAMSEEGRMSLGYGTLESRQTLPDTFTGGLNMLTGIDSSGLKAMSDTDATDEITKQMAQTPIALTAQTLLANNKYLKVMENNASASAGKNTALQDLNSTLSKVIDKWDSSEQRVSNTYRELGIRESTLETVQTRLSSTKATLQSQYKDKVGIDTYDAIVKMYSQQYAYTAAMKVGSNIMQSSLFDYVSS
jgi:flagellar hook-associated protein 3 FlgL